MVPSTYVGLHSSYKMYFRAAASLCHSNAYKAQVLQHLGLCTRPAMRRTLDYEDSVRAPSYLQRESLCFLYVCSRAGASNAKRIKSISQVQGSRRFKFASSPASSLAAAVPIIKAHNTGLERDRVPAACLVAGFPSCLLV
jgi:hypothetical protein